MSALAFIRFGPTPRAWAVVPLLCLLLVIAVADLRTGMIRDVFTLPGIAYALLVAATLGTPSFVEAIVGMLVAGGFVLLMALIGPRGVGGGDVKLMALLGAALGWKLALIALGLAYVVSGIGLVLLIAFRRRGARDLFPVGAFMAIIGAFLLAAIA